MMSYDQFVVACTITGIFGLTLLVALVLDLTAQKDRENKLRKIARGVATAAPISEPRIAESVAPAPKPISGAPRAEPNLAQMTSALEKLYAKAKESKLVSPTSPTLEQLKSALSSMVAKANEQARDTREVEQKTVEPKVAEPTAAEPTISANPIDESEREKMRKMFQNASAKAWAVYNETIDKTAAVIAPRRDDSVYSWNYCAALGESREDWERTRDAGKRASGTDIRKTKSNKPDPSRYGFFPYIQPHVESDDTQKDSDEEFIL